MPIHSRHETVHEMRWGGGPRPIVSHMSFVSTRTADSATRPCLQAKRDRPLAPGPTRRPPNLPLPPSHAHTHTHPPMLDLPWPRRGGRAGESAGANRVCPQVCHACHGGSHGMRGGQGAGAAAARGLDLCRHGDATRRPCVWPVPAAACGCHRVCAPLHPAAPRRALRPRQLRGPPRLRAGRAAPF